VKSGPFLSRALITTALIAFPLQAAAQEPVGGAPPTPVAPAPTADVAEPTDEAPAPAPAAEPAASEPVDIGALDLDDLLDKPLRGGELGSTGKTLEGLDVRPYLHGYITADWEKEGDEPNQFDIDAFGLFLGANIAGVIVPEVLLEAHPDAFIEADEDVLPSLITTRYAQVDVRLHESLVVRAGQFITPFLLAGEYYYTGFLAITPAVSDLEGFYGGLIPSEWHETGIQLRGRVPFGEHAFTYAAFVSNGIEQPDDPTTPEVDDGAPGDDWFSNVVDTNADKAVGVRAGIVLAMGLQADISGYTGAYTPDGEQRLTILGADVLYEHGKVRGYGEVALTRQTVAAGDDVQRWGTHAHLGYRVLDWLEPAVGADYVDLDGATVRIGRLGVNFFPYVSKVPTFVVRGFATLENSNGEEEGTDGEDEEQERIYQVQASVGF
jgi:hypothetical protein